MIYLQLAAAVLLAILARGIFVLFAPYRTCRWCRPGGLVGGSLPARLAGHEPERKRKRKRRCWRCRGSRLTRRLGAKQVHKVKVSLLQTWDERESWR